VSRGSDGSQCIKVFDIHGLQLDMNNMQMLEKECKVHFDYVNQLPVPHKSLPKNLLLSPSFSDKDRTRMSSSRPGWLESYQRGKRENPNNCALFVIPAEDEQVPSSFQEMINAMTLVKQFTATIRKHDNTTVERPVRAYWDTAAPGKVSHSFPDHSCSVRTHPDQFAASQTRLDQLGSARTDQSQSGPARMEALQEDWGMKLPCQVAGVNVDAYVTAHPMLDTGASTTFMDRAFVVKHGFAVHPAMDGCITTLANGSSVPVAGVLDVKLRLGELTHKTRVTVVELNGVHDLVLGRTLFQELKAVLDFGESTCTFKKGTKKVTLKAHVPKGQPQSRVLSAKQFMRASKGQQVYLCVVKSSGELSVDEQLDADTATEVPKGPLEPWVSELLDEYASIFSTGTFPDKPAARAVPHAIPLLPNSQPTFRPMLRLSPKELGVLKEYVAELLEKGLIRPSTSPYGASAIFVPKPDGTLRVCIDYRAINKITVKNKYPLPRIDDLLDKLSGAKYFSSLDLQTGFHQVPIQEVDIEKTAFRTPFGHFEWTVLPLGLCNSAPTFQMVMNNTFKEYVDKSVLVYMDDILVFSKTEEEHKVHLRQVLERLRECNFKLRLKKCSFSHTQLKYVGHIVSEEGITADPAKTSTVEDWPTPSSVSEVRQFTGFANYFRKYIKAYSAMASPLTNLTRKSSAFTWGKAQQEAFQAIKYALTHAPVLVMPDFTKPFEVWCDASKLGLGALLMQEGRPVAYESRKLKPAEMNYGVGEQELLAVVHALKTWRCYVEGVQFTVVKITTLILS
jgi:Reverse transcriptase (RNA-dependent DNA polymerase)/RNase H-like domain found in reverse transcriptase/Aspartyl protease